MVFDFLRTLARVVENGVREKFSKNVNISWSTSNGSGSPKKKTTRNSKEPQNPFSISNDAGELAKNLFCQNG
jgi:hypothetical protein